ncbi:xanthine dehydrogenase family protein molybdopterin-binding subunit [Pseudoflavonifractor capillosus]|uniref:xanthine dehydrogenase family protein molybdopterin-binding subunit n=1 Tax=Pseudoflavonifractor capillosus TaxID=106588 RepID=UPI001957D3F7|nr:molybdopterin cofactor-binding domain-containing protein [Pseudoflavonifractor capillosus]MBM6680698.1 molybdopterin-dependent oxidoreductase [Pseudoflavonifractor capillosus]
MEGKTYQSVGQPVRKKDAMALLLGKPAYVDDVTPRDCLVVKVLRSPHAHALIEEIDTSAAMKVPGIAAIFTYRDVPQKRFTMAGQTYPEPSPYDRLILDQRVRFVGDAVAIVAGETEQAVDRAMKLIRVRYQVLEAVLDPHEALDSPILVHPEDSWRSLCPVGADNRRNLCASETCSDGDVDQVLADCPCVVDRVYHTKACNQAMMETFRTYTEMDPYGRLHVVSSTQIVFHVRRILANALDIPKSKIHVEKPRIGGGFGAKQTVVAEVYPALVTWKTGRPAKMIYSREESQIAASPRHEMEVHVRLGATRDGVIRALDVYTLSNTGAYGEHGPTTVGLSGHKSIPLYTGNLEAFRFAYDVVYTNRQSAGAYRGYGATQGIFAVESAVNELADRLGMDPVALREKNMVREGQIMPAYYNEPASACALDKCMERCKELFGWEEKFPVRDMGNGKVRAAGVAMAMQGSGISGVDVGSATIKLSDEGFYNLSIGAADMGTGCDTILAQIAAECLECSVDNIAVFGADSDASPYDSGSYASSTTYVTGKAVEQACTQLKEQICAIAAQMLDCSAGELEFAGDRVRRLDGMGEVALAEIATKSMCGNPIAVQATSSHTSPVSPPPFMVGMAQVEVDKETGSVEVLDYAAVVDCGTPINPNLARVQTEGGIVQGIGMALFEDVTYNEKGRLLENSFLQYKIPTRLDMGHLKVEFAPSYEPSGPFGAKSIGEIVINTPSPAIAQAVFRATGVWHRELPITPEKVLMGMKNRG